MLRNKITLVCITIGALAMLGTTLNYHFKGSFFTSQPASMPQATPTTTASAPQGQMPDGAMNMSKLFGDENVDPVLSQRAGELMQQMQANPQDPQVAIDLALLFLEAEDYVASLNFATRASTLDPSNPSAAYLKGIAHSQLAEFNEAVAEFERSLSLQESPVTHYGLAVLYKYNINDTVKAKSHLEKALQTPELSEDLKQRILTELEGL